MFRLCFLAVAFSFIATAAPLPLPILPGFVANTSTALSIVKPDMLCNAIQELDHDVCGNAAQAPLCRVLSELNSTLCSNIKDRVFAHTGETLCPLLMFIDEALCSNATATATGVEARRDSINSNVNKIKPADFCPIIELADKELCGGITKQKNKQT